MELLGYAQPCVAHAGETVEVKVSTTQPGFTAEVVRLGLATEPVVPRVAGGDFPGRQQELRSGSYLIAELGEPTDAESSVQFWFFPTLLAGRQCLMAGFAAGGGWEVAISDERRLSFARLSAAGEVLGSVSAGPQIQARRWYFAAACWDAAGMVTLAVAARDPRRPDADTDPPGRHDLSGALPTAGVITVGAAVPRGRPLRCFDGKIDTPRVFTGALSPAALRALAADADAARVGGLRHEWRLDPEAALPPHRVRDAGPGAGTESSSTCRPSG